MYTASPYHGASPAQPANGKPKRKQVKMAVRMMDLSFQRQTNYTYFSVPIALRLARNAMKAALVSDVSGPISLTHAGMESERSERGVSNVVPINEGPGVILMKTPKRVMFQESLPSSHNA
jgi:hypothetical protein